MKMHLSPLNRKCVIHLKSELITPFHSKLFNTEWIGTSGRFSWILISLPVKYIWIHPSRNHIRQEFPRVVRLWDFKVQLVVEYYIHPLHLKHSQIHTHTHTQMQPSTETREWARTSILFFLWARFQSSFDSRDLVPLSVPQKRKLEKKRLPGSS